MAGREVPKVRVSKKKFDEMLERFGLSYIDIGCYPEVDRTSSSISQNLREGLMPIYTVIGIAEALDVDVKTFAPNAIKDKEIKSFVRIMSPEQRKKLYSYLGSMLKADE